MTTQVREPRQDRSRATRQRLLESAVDSLCEIGWQGTTVAVVAERAGVSRGAAQHHFPAMEDLFTAAVEYMAEVRIDEIKREVVGLPTGQRRTAETSTSSIATSPLTRRTRSWPAATATSLSIAARASVSRWPKQWRTGSR